MCRSSTVIAIEGPSDSGKSTLAGALAGFPDWQPTTLLPCYVDMVPPERLPPDLGRSLEEQLDGVDFFAALDHARQQQETGQAEEPRIVVADRSWLSVLAHTYAVERNGGPPAYEEARRRLAADDRLLQPDIVVVLQATDATREARMRPADRGAWFTSPAFNAHFDRFFIEEAPSLVSRLVAVDANSSASEVASRAIAALTDAGVRP